MSVDRRHLHFGMWALGLALSLGLLVLLIVILRTEPLDDVLGLFTKSARPSPDLRFSSTRCRERTIRALERRVKKERDWVLHLMIEESLGPECFSFHFPQAMDWYEREELPASIPASWIQSWEAWEVEQQKERISLRWWWIWWTVVPVVLLPVLVAAALVAARGLLRNR